MSNVLSGESARMRWGLLTLGCYLYLSKNLLRKQREVPVNSDRTEIDDAAEITSVV